MTSVVPAGASRTNVRVGREDIDELALALVTPLGAEATAGLAIVCAFTFSHLLGFSMEGGATPTRRRLLPEL
jgi:hypothetical protein